MGTKQIDYSHAFDHLCSFDENHAVLVVLGDITVRLCATHLNRLCEQGSASWQKQDSNTPYLHIYGQQAWHGTVYIAGTRAGLTILKHAIEKALAGMSDTACEEQAFAVDGEGYVLSPLLRDERTLCRFALPYMDEMAQDTRPDAIWPDTMEE